MSELASATAWVAAGWLATTATFVGIGLHGLRLLGLRELDGERVLLAFWGGFCATIALLQVWHLFWPVSEWSLLLLGGIGTAGLLRSRAALAAWSRRLLRGSPLALGIGTLAVLWLAAIATGPCLYGDTGMYHLPMARWLVSHPIVPGLANLHGRFGFNNSSLLYVALFETGALEGRSHHLANGPLVAMFSAGLVLSVRRLLARDARASGERAADVFYLFLFVPAVHVALSRQFTSLSTDLPTALLLMVGAWRMARLLAQPPPVSAADRRLDLAFVSATFTTAIACKITSLPLATLAFALLAALVLAPRAWGGRPRELALPVAIGAAVLVPWCLRGVLLSGYPVYPVAVLPVPVEWRVPEEQVEAERAWALASSRSDKSLDPEEDWLGYWLARRAAGPLIGGAILVGVAGTALALAAGALARARRGRRGRSAGQLGLGALVAVGGLSSAAWFVLGPNPRFGFAILWIFAASSAALCALAFPRLERRGARAFLVLFCALAGLSNAWYLTTDPKLPWRSHWLSMEPGEDGGLHPYKTVELSPYDTEHGLRLYVPDASNNAWGHVPPATPYPAPNLRLRREGDLASGFAVEGDWNPEGWPKTRSAFLIHWRRWRAERQVP